MVGSRRRGLNFDIVEHVPRQRIHQQIPNRSHANRGQLTTGVVETNCRLSRHQVTEQIAFGQRQVVRILQREFRMRQRSGDVNFHSDVTTIRALPRLANSVDGGNIERRIQIRSAEEQQRSALHVEGRLHERIDQIQPIRALVRAQISLQRQLRRLTRTLRRQRHTQ